MKFFFPDSQDLVDPTFDFVTERRSVDRLRHRDDCYAHEVFKSPPYDGMLISKGIVDGLSGLGGKYSLSQKHRLLRVGVQEFFRLGERHGRPIPVMGDCGAFTYVKEKYPPFSVDEVLEFYGACGVDLGISVDHVILDYQPRWDRQNESNEARAAAERQKITLELAAEFLSKCRGRRLPFTPVGVAQGWSPSSYATAVSALERIGFRYIAMGGMVPLKTSEILAVLRFVAATKAPDTSLHLLGITRTEYLDDFAGFGVVSFDSTSPLRQAFKDDKNNFHTPKGAFTAVRVPQVEGNATLQRRVRAGEVKQPHALSLERKCLELLRRYDADDATLDSVVAALDEYEAVHSPGRSFRESNIETLSERPWRACACDVCQALGIHVVLFRGAERNRRRGFHNLWVFYNNLRERKNAGARDVGQASLAF